MSLYANELTTIFNTMSCSLDFNMTFSEAQKLLLQQNRTVVYSSLTSDKIHSLECTIPRRFQTEGDKIVVWDINFSVWRDIEVSTIQSIT